MNPFSIFCKFRKKYTKKVKTKIQNIQKKEEIHENDIHKDETHDNQKKDYEPYVLNQNSKHTINGTIIFKSDVK